MFEAVGVTVEEDEEETEAERTAEEAEALTEEVEEERVNLAQACITDTLSIASLA